MLAAHRLNSDTFLSSLIAFICFSLFASSVYVLNDLLDLSADRAHPRKKMRPFASGSMPIVHGTSLAVGLIILGVLLSVSISNQFLVAMATYFLLTTTYSLFFKRQIVIDICLLAGLYTARIIVGGIANDIPLSIWLITFSVFFFLSLATVKRQAELLDYFKNGKLKVSGRGYHVEDLPIVSMIAIGAGYVSVLVMALYVSSEDVVQLYTHPKALWGVCTVLLYWISRVVMVANRGQMHDDPVVYALRDRVSRTCMLITVVFIIWATI
jgi:4-hydroxybenzoate polyprenyltransferase